VIISSQGKLISVVSVPSDGDFFFIFFFVLSATAYHFTLVRRLFETEFVVVDKGGLGGLLTLAGGFLEEDLSAIFLCGLYLALFTFDSLLAPPRANAVPSNTLVACAVLTLTGLGWLSCWPPPSCLLQSDFSFSAFILSCLACSICFRSLTPVLPLVA